MEHRNLKGLTSKQVYYCKNLLKINLPQLYTEQKYGKSKFIVWKVSTGSGLYPFVPRTEVWC
ncbi:hypothetical protein CA264_08615 [Pontibacter actiniarum]|uniref:Uncharacterized protein n=1 Tax=Pontibacter actiniarum TaxID=323450 RepID=A0A1X9YRM8_9BACT|nr:hypothetical protein CA264_08615 [Pontibacter actiniarum]